MQTDVAKLARSDTRPLVAHVQHRSAVPVPADCAHPRADFHLARGIPRPQRRAEIAQRSVYFAAPLVKFANPGGYQVDVRRFEQDIFARPRW